MDDEVRAKNKNIRPNSYIFFNSQQCKNLYALFLFRLPPDEQQGYKLSTQYLPRNYEKFVRHVPPKKNIKKKKKE